MALYNLIFQGKIIDGASLDEVKANVARLFKADPTKTAVLFSGKPIVIKKNLDTEAAKKYLAVLKKAGAVVKAEKVKAEKVASSVTGNNTAPPPGQAQTDAPSTAAPSKGLSAGLASLVNFNSSAQPPDQEPNTAAKETPATDDLQLAPANSGNLSQEKHIESVQIPDISHLSMSDAQTGTLEEFSHPVEAVELPDIDNLTLSEANMGSLEEFAVTVAPVELPDISALDVAEQGDIPLSAESPKPEAIEIPDTSDLSMSEPLEGTLAGIEKKPEPVKIPDISHLDIDQPEEQQTSSQKAIFQID